MMTPMDSRIAGGFVVVAAVAAAVVPVPPEWVEQFYSRVWFPPVQRALTSISNTCPFALLDVLLVAASVLGVLALGSIARAPRGRRLASLARRAAQAAVVAALAYLAFVAAWAGNYRRQPLTALLDFDDARVTREAVIALNDAAIAEVSRLRPRLPPGPSGWSDAAQAATDIGESLDVGSRLLGLPGPVRAGRPKWTVLDVYLTRAGVSGMTNPFFLETLVASNLLPFELPVVIAHEWGHLAGLARESDASFFGLLVCLHGSEAAQYSAWLDIYVRTLGAREPAERPAALARLPDAVRADLRAMADRSKRDQVRAVSLMAWRTYDTYLRSQRVESGVRNYGEVVRLVAGTRFEPGWTPALRDGR
jgi:hypothetical protein